MKKKALIRIGMTLIIPGIIIIMIIAGKINIFYYEVVLAKPDIREVVDRADHLGVLEGKFKLKGGSIHHIKTGREFIPRREKKFIPGMVPGNKKFDGAIIGVNPDLDIETLLFYLQYDRQLESSYPESDAWINLPIWPKRVRKYTLLFYMEVIET